MKMWISLGSMGFMFISIVLVYFSRFKLQNRVIKFIFSLLAFIFMVLAGIIIFFVVMTGPTD
ncbi:DUF2768 domain-containing protein [Bacillus dakarensis]|uniref:DUF2768 domain-containing protein n=1 Tax=Robertmurraya dakarensis TaxID=1926278 RepID=UPI00301BB7ED